MSDEKSALEFVAVPMALREQLADAPMEQVGMALMLALYCGLQCNGGVIAGARLWSSRQTLVRVGLTRIPTEDAAGLWEWQGDDLHVLLYSTEYERKTLARRRAGREAIAARWRNAANADKSISYTDVNTMVIPTNYDSNTDVNTMVIQGKGKGKNKGGSGVCARTREAEAGPAPAPTPDGFASWLAALCSAHPSASKSRTLAPDVMKAALDAFGRYPDADEQVELLTAYLRDRRLEDNGFYAPRGQRKFFEDLEDVMSHAERWRRWSGWKPKKKAEKSPSAPAKGGMSGSEGASAPGDTEAFFRAVKGDLGMTGEEVEA